MLMRDEVKAAAEAILFTRAEPIPLEELVEILDVGLLDLKPIMRELLLQYNQEKRGLQIVDTDNGYLMCTRPEYAGFLAGMRPPLRKRLSGAALETLAVIAYQQPVTRAEIEAVRGVKIDRIITMLLEKNLIEEAGHKPVAGKPLLYQTTPEFLKVFGLTSLKDLPVLEEELNV
jgi:segregation and condensation protein B